MGGVALRCPGCSSWVPDGEELELSSGERLCSDCAVRLLAVPGGPDLPSTEHVHTRARVRRSSTLLRVAKVIFLLLALAALVAFVMLKR
jgi:hypothetical protein